MYSELLYVWFEDLRFTKEYLDFDVAFISTCELIKNLPPTITIKTLITIDSCLRIERFSCSIDKLMFFLRLQWLKNTPPSAILRHSAYYWLRPGKRGAPSFKSKRSAFVTFLPVTCKLHVNRNHWSSWHSVWENLIQRPTFAYVKIRSFDSLSFQYVYCNRLPNPTTK